MTDEIIHYNEMIDGKIDYQRLYLKSVIYHRKTINIFKQLIQILSRR